MKPGKIPCCYHPTTVLAVDDNVNFLNAIKANLADKIVCKIFSNPLEAKSYLEELVDYSPFTYRCIKKLDNEQVDHVNIDIDVRSIHKEMYRSDRFEQISVIIVDEDMPGLSGLELCQQLADYPVKKILLTGKVKEDHVIEAFNRGMIDKYIAKNSSDMPQELLKNIYELQHQYFLDLSQQIYSKLVEFNDYPVFYALNNMNFTQQLEEFYTAFNGIEYYLCDLHGSFVFVNENAELAWLIVKHEDGMKTMAFLAETSDKSISDTLMLELEQREKIVFLYNDADLQCDPGDWEAKNLIHKATVMPGDMNHYYYSFICGHDGYVPENHISSYHEYLRE